MSDSTKPAASMEMSQSAKYYTLAILTIVYVFNFIDRQILVILQPLIKADLDLSDTQLGLLSGIAFAFFTLCSASQLRAWLIEAIDATLLRLHLPHGAQ